MADDKLSIRLTILETYIRVPPSNDYARGYLACLMDDAAEDIDEAASDTFEKALGLVDEVHRASLKRQRAITLR